MKIKQVVDYIFHTPLNTNKAILIGMLKELIISNGGSLDGQPEEPDTPDENKDIIYDGGIEE